MPTLQESGPAHRGDSFASQSDYNPPPAIVRSENSFFATTEAGMYMKTNTTATIYYAKMATFWHDLAECSDIFTRTFALFLGIGGLFVKNRGLADAIRISKSRNAGTGLYRARRCCRRLFIATPGASAPPLLSQGGEILLRIGRGVIGASRGGFLACGKCRWRPRCL